MTEGLRAHAEQQFADELATLERADEYPKPPSWRLSPWAVVTYLLGDDGHGITGHVIHLDGRPWLELAAQNAVGGAGLK